MIETFIDQSRGLRTKKTAVAELVRLAGFTPDVAAALAKDMRRTIAREGAIAVRNRSLMHENRLAVHLARRNKAPYNVATSYGEQDGREKPEEDRD